VLVVRARQSSARRKRFRVSAGGGRARRRDVTVGLVGTNDVRVTAGLNEGDVVILPGLSSLRRDARQVGES